LAALPVPLVSSKLVCFTKPQILTSVHCSYRRTGCWP
jgi:hypothetical protein